MKRPHLYWTPCTAHYLDLMLEDIRKLPQTKKTIKRSISISGYTYNRVGLLNTMRRFIEQRKLLRLAMTWFAMAFITLSVSMNEKSNLMKMFISEDPKGSKCWEREKGGKYSQYSAHASFLEHYDIFFEGIGPSYTCSSISGWWKETSYVLHLCGHEKDKRNNHQKL